MFEAGLLKFDPNFRNSKDKRNQIRQPAQKIDDVEKQS